MLLISIKEGPDYQLTQSKTETAGRKAPQPIKDSSVENVSETTEASKTPTNAATFAAAAQAKGIKKIELEIAATAGLLRPIGPDNPTISKRSDHDLGTLIKTVEDLEKPEKPHNIDLFE